MQENVATQASTPPSRVKLVAMRTTWFRTDDGRVVNLEECSNDDFDAFIARYLDFEDVDRRNWTLMLRWRAVNFAVRNGQFLEFVEAAQEAVLEAMESDE